MVLSAVRLASSLRIAPTSASVSVSNICCSSTSALTGMPAPNRLSAALAGFFSGSTAVPFQNNMPFESRPKGWCEHAPRISGLTFSDFAMTCSSVVRGVVASTVGTPDRQLTLPVWVDPPGYLNPW